MSRPQSAPDTWGPRDLPVLVSIVTRFDRQGAVGSEGVVEDTGLDEETVAIACQALRDAGHIAYQDSANVAVWVTSVSAEARRLTGAWPTPDALVDRLLTALQQAVDDAPSPDERNRRQKALDGVRSAGRDILVSIAAAALGGVVT